MLKVAGAGTSAWEWWKLLAARWVGDVAAPWAGDVWNRRVFETAMRVSGTAAGEPLVKDCFDRRGDNWGGDRAGVETLPRLCGCWKVTEGGVRGLLTELWRSGL